MSSRGLWTLGWLVAASLVLLPDLVRLDQWTPFVQLVAFRPLLIVMVGVAAVLALLPEITRPIGIGVLVVVLIAAGMVLPRTWRLSISVAGEEDRGTAWNVLTINVQGGEVPAVAVARLVRKWQVDLVSLPEATEEYRLSVEKALDGDYKGFSHQGSKSKASATSALHHKNLGTLSVEAVTTTTFPALVLTGGSLGKTRFVAFHAHPPLPLRTDRWRHDLGELRAWCTGRQPAIIAGDFNASLDHGVFRRSMADCEDVARARGRGLSSTWPIPLPIWFGTQIDHVLYHGNLYPADIEFVEVDRGDHRGVWARVVA